jgi:hypothetical protein
MLRGLLIGGSLFAVVLGGCGSGNGPDPGSRCEEVGYRCADDSTALECRAAAATGALSWVELPCRGPDGCRTSSGTVTCDVSANVAGDACSTSMEGKGFCTADGKAAMICRSGVFEKAADCVSCTVDAGQVVCQP